MPRPERRVLIAVKSFIAKDIQRSFPAIFGSNTAPDIEFYYCLDTSDFPIDFEKMARFELALCTHARNEAQRCLPPNITMTNNSTANIAIIRKKIFQPDLGDSPCTSPVCPLTTKR